MIFGIHVYILTEIRFYAGDTHIQQILQQALIPLHSLRIGEVDGSGIIQSGEV